MLDPRIEHILLKISQNNGNVVYDSESASCLACYAKIDRIHGLVHKDSCIVSVAKKVLEENR